VLFSIFRKKSSELRPDTLIAYTIDGRPGENYDGGGKRERPERREYAALYAISRDRKAGNFLRHDDRETPSFLRKDDGEVR